jgi:hypothetical protein
LYNIATDVVIGGGLLQLSADRQRGAVLAPKSIYNIEENANVVVVRTDISFKICHGKKPASRQIIDIS